MALRREGYWDEHYSLELRNYEEDGDEGEVWFGKGLSRRIFDWILETIRSKNRSTSDKWDILDVGCGNSYTLTTLVERAKDKLSVDHLDNLRLFGLDYSRNSIDLSKKIVLDKGYTDVIALEQCDFLNHKEVSEVTKDMKFDIVIDKGTFDAICLLASDSPEKLKAAKLNYIQSVYSVSKVSSTFILASCNSTEEELLPIFDIDSPGKRETKLIGRIESPKIQFGGKEGSQVTCLIMEFT